MMSYATYSRFDDEEIELGNDWGFYEDIEVRTTCKPIVIEKNLDVAEKEEIHMNNIEKLLANVQRMNRRRDEQYAEVDLVSKYTHGLTRGLIMTTILISIIILN